MVLKRLDTETFQVSLQTPHSEGGKWNICLGENNPHGGNNTIYFHRDRIKELIQLLKLADSEFKE